MASWPSGSYSVLPANRLLYSPWQAVCFILFTFYFLVYYFSLCLFLNDRFLVRFRYHKYLFPPQLEQFHTKQLIRWDGICGWLRVAFCAVSVQMVIQGALTSHHHQMQSSLGGSSALDPQQFTYYHDIVLEDLFDHRSSQIAPSQNREQTLILKGARLFFTVPSTQGEILAVKTATLLHGLVAQKRSTLCEAFWLGSGLLYEMRFSKGKASLGDRKNGMQQHRAGFFQGLG